MLVAVVAGFVMFVVSRKFMIVRELSADHCRFNQFDYSKHLDPF